MLTTLLSRAAIAALAFASLPSSVSAASLAPPGPVRTYASHGELPGALARPGGITAVGPSTAVADTGNDRVSLFDRSGRHVRDLGGFASPHDVAATPEGDLAVADTKNNRIVVMSPDGTIRFSFGRVGLDAGEFLLPMGVAVAADGSIVVSDHANHRIQVFDRRGHWQRSIDGLRYPRGVTTHDDRILVATGDRIAVFDLDGRAVRSDPLGWAPSDVAVDPAGRLIVTDPEHSRVEVIDGSGRRLTSFGGPGSGPARFGAPPSGVTSSGSTIHTVDSSGRVHAWRFRTCAGRAASHVGTNGDDRIVGTNGPDVIVALAGDDHVRGRGGRDVICLGAGHDVAWGGYGADLLRGGGGRDVIRGRGGSDVLRGGAGDDLLHGGRGSDTCRGGSGSDTIRACEGKASAHA